MVCSKPIPTERALDSEFVYFANSVPKKPVQSFTDSRTMYWVSVMDKAHARSRNRNKYKSVLLSRSLQFYKRDKLCT